MILFLEEEERPTFGMKMIKTHSSALSRQVHEAVRIRRRASSSNILNSRAVYNRCVLPSLRRLVVEAGKKEEESDIEYLKDIENIIDITTLAKNVRRENLQEKTDQQREGEQEGKEGMQG